MSWIVGNSFSLEQKKIDPEDKSIEELMTDKKSWIFEGNKPARICSQILLRLSVLSSKKIYHGSKKRRGGRLLWFTVILTYILSHILNNVINYFLYRLKQVNNLLQ